MISTRIYLITMIMIFVFFGLGILIGNGLGGEWVDKSYQGIVANLEKKILHLSLDKEQLNHEINKLMSQEKKLNQAWINYFVAQKTNPFQNKKGVIVTHANEITWTTLLKEMGVQIKVAPTLESIKDDILHKTFDFVIYDNPNITWLTQVAQLHQEIPFVIIGERLFPNISGKFFMQDQIPDQFEDQIHFLNNLRLLLLK